MAESPSHKFGQIIGELLEIAIRPRLLEFARKYSLYLDCKGPREARQGNKVSWTDIFGNTHDLDFVLERGGSENKIGTPVAFIESAWRRYTKHSRNKAQEIQGAIQPLALTNQNTAPFIGVILAGVFTEGSLTQLKSLGFRVLYFHYDTIIEAFKEVGIDADFDETTADESFRDKITAWENLTKEKQELATRALIRINKIEVEKFMKELEQVVTRFVASVRILPLHGTAFNYKTIEDAIRFIENFGEKEAQKNFIRYEIEIVYNNGDIIRGTFKQKDQAIKFLANYQPSRLTPVKR